LEITFQALTLNNVILNFNSKTQLKVRGGLKVKMIPDFCGIVR